MQRLRGLGAFRYAVGRVSWAGGPIAQTFILNSRRFFHKTSVNCEQNVEKEKVPQREGFHKPYSLSKPLGNLVGATELSRPQLAKEVWNYIKARDLQDPTDKRYIKCDESMQEVFKTDRVHMFTMNKILNEHLHPVKQS